MQCVKKRRERLWATELWRECARLPDWNGNEKMWRCVLFSACECTGKVCARRIGWRIGFGILFRKITIMRCVLFVIVLMHSFWKKKKKRFDDSLAIWGTGTPSQFPLVRSSAQDKGIAFCDFAIRHVPESPKTSSYNCITNAISLTKICWFSNVNKNLPNCSPVLGNCDIRHEMNGVNKTKVVISLSWLSCLIWFVSLRLGLLRCAAVTDRTGHDNADDSTGANVGATGHLHSRIVPERCGFGKGADERCRGLLRSRRQELLW